MRKEADGAKLNHLNIFSLDELNTNNNFESGLSTTVGFDYESEGDNNQEIWVNNGSGHQRKRK